MEEQTVDAGAQKAIAEAVRREWIENLNSGIADIHVLIACSREKDERKYIGAIRLVNILTARPNWTKAIALDVLQRHGFNEKTTIRTLRGSPVQRDAFELILKTQAGRWRLRSAIPEGWPWSGKLSVLTEQAGAAVPDELLSLLDDDDPIIADTPSEETASAERALMDLLGDDDDDDDEDYGDEE